MYKAATKKARKKRGCSAAAAVGQNKLAYYNGLPKSYAIGYSKQLRLYFSSTDKMRLHSGVTWWLDLS